MLLLLLRLKPLLLLLRLKALLLLRLKALVEVIVIVVAESLLWPEPLLALLLSEGVLSELSLAEQRPPLPRPRGEVVSGGRVGEELGGEGGRLVTGGQGEAGAGGGGAEAGLALLPATTPQPGSGSAELTGGCTW